MARVRLNGWQRLWVVATGMMGVVAVVAMVDLFKTEQYVDDSYQSEVVNLRDIKKVLLDPNITEVDSRYSYKKNWTIAEVNDRIADAGEDYTQKLKHLTMEQTKAIVIPLALWLLASSTVYGLGWTAHWVYRGFRPKGKSTS